VQPIERIWCAVKNPIANNPVVDGGMKELDRRLRVNFLGAAGLKPGEELKRGEKQTVTRKVLISSRRQTLEHELEYSKYVLDAHGELQAPEDVSDSDDEDEADLHHLITSTGDESDESDDSDVEE